LEFNVPFQHKYGYIRDDDKRLNDSEHFNIKQFKRTEVDKGSV